MTEDRARHLMQIVKMALAERGFTADTHSDYDDLLQEACVAAWRAVEAMPADCPYSWTTVASRNGYWAVLNYLDDRRSGRMAHKGLQRPGYRARRREAEPVSEAELNAQREPVPLSALPLSEYEGAWDGGMAAADARLQLWAWRPPLSRREAQVIALVLRPGLSLAEAARVLSIERRRCYEYYRRALAKYRFAAEYSR